MLVLKRASGERVRLTVPTPSGEPIEVVVTVLDVDGGRVKLGFEAPTNVKILRGELEEIARENAAAAKSDPGAIREGLRRR